MQITKILNPVYTAVTSFSVNADGSLSATYQIGTGVENDGQVSEFTPLMTEYKYLDQEQAQQLLNVPLTKDDIGKSYQDVMLSRIYTFLQEQGMITT